MQVLIVVFERLEARNTQPVRFANPGLQTRARSVLQLGQQLNICFHNIQPLFDHCAAVTVVKRVPSSGLEGKQLT